MADGLAADDGQGSSSGPRLDNLAPPTAPPLYDMVHQDRPAAPHIDENYQQFGVTWGCEEDTPFAFTDYLPPTTSEADPSTWGWSGLPGGPVSDSPWLPPLSTNDHMIVEQQNAIRAELLAVPFVGDMEDLGSLKAEYEAGNHIFRAKLESLSQSYSSMRRTKGDGNCFYRAFIFSYLEGLVLFNRVEECRRFTECIRGWRQKLLDCNFQELVFEDWQDILLDLVAAIGRDVDPMTPEELLMNLRDDMTSNLIIMFLRMLTSAELQRRQEFFAPFIMGMYDEAPSVEFFCHKCVEVMGEECDHVHIVALSDALEIPITVVYLDRSGSAALEGSSQPPEMGVDTYNFVPEACGPEVKARPPAVMLLYRPGHYDILYPV